MIGAIEGQDVATADILGDFPHTDYEKGDIHIKMEGETVNLLQKIDPD